MVAIVTGVAISATWFFGRRAVPMYQSSATIRVDSKRGVFQDLNDLDVADLSLRTDPVLSEALVLKTQALGFMVADAGRMQLYFGPGQQRSDYVYQIEVDSGAVPDSFRLEFKGARGYELRRGTGNGLIASGDYHTRAVAPGFSFMVQPSDIEMSVSFSIIARYAAASMASGGLGYQIQPSTNIVTVTYTGTDPSVVPVALDLALRALQQSGVQRIQDMADQRLAYITERVEFARQQYLTSLSRMQSYQESQHTTDLTAEEVALIQSIQAQEREKERRQLDIATMRGIMGEGSDVRYETVNSLAAVAAIQSNPAMQFQLENLLKLYDERQQATAGQLGLRETNPAVQAIDIRIRSAARSLIDAANATIRSLESQLASIEETIRASRARLATYPGKQTQFAQLQLDTDLQNDTYKYLLSQQEAARIQRATIAPYVSIVEPARPAARIGMGLRQKLMLGLIIGLSLAVLTAFFLEYLDQTIKTSADVERALEVPVLGLIPYEGSKGQPVTVQAHNGGGRRRQSLPLVSLMSPDHPASEAYRTLRTNVTFVNAEQRQLQLLVVTSPGPGEGKSTTAANLAITLAQQGSRTLLVDADLRRPLVHRAFNLVQEPGLTDVLVGTAQVREAIRPNVVPKLDVLPAGALPPNPSELLGSDAMRTLLEQLRAQYEIIIFDSPPTLAVTDATVLGASSDAVILVVRAGETEEVAAQRALQQLRRVQARVAGTVLNGIRKDRDRYYNYYSYYRGERATKDKVSVALPGMRGASN